MIQWGRWTLGGGRERQTDGQRQSVCSRKWVGRWVPQWTLDRRAQSPLARLRQRQSRSGHSIVVHSLLLQDSDRDSPAVDTRSSCTVSSCETQTETVPLWTLDRRAQTPLARLRQRQSRSGHLTVVRRLLLRDSETAPQWTLDRRAQSPLARLRHAAAEAARLGVV